MHQTPVLRIPAVDLLAQADSAQDYPELTGNWSTPVVRAGGTTGFVSPGDFAVRKMHIFQMSEVQIVRVLAVVHVALDINDNRVFKCGGVVILLVAISRGSIPLNNDFSHTFTGGQCGKQKRRRLVKDLGNGSSFFPRCHHSTRSPIGSANWSAGTQTRVHYQGL